MGFLLIVSGPPGAGKSTVSRRLADSFDPSVLVEGDAFFGFLASGAIQPWLRREVRPMSILKLPCGYGPWYLI